MSAFLVSDETYAALARFMLEDRPDIVELHLAPRFELGARNFVEVCRLANHKALNARYNDAMPKRGDLKPIDPYSTTVLMKAEDALQALTCITYQCAEEWDGADAFIDFMQTVAVPLFAQGAKHTEEKYRVRDGVERTYYRAVNAQDAAYGHWERAEQPKPPPEKLPDGYDKSEWQGGTHRKVMRRDTLKKLNAAGRLELVESYSYDDGYGQSGYDGPPKQVTIADWDIDNSELRQWTNEHGHFVYVRHHSNSNATYRVKPEAAKAKAA